MPVDVKNVSRFSSESESLCNLFENVSFWCGFVIKKHVGLINVDCFWSIPSLMKSSSLAVVVVLVDFSQLSADTECVNVSGSGLMMKCVFVHYKTDSSGPWFWLVEPRSKHCKLHYKPTPLFTLCVAWQPLCSNHRFQPQLFLRNYIVWWKNTVLVISLHLFALFYYVKPY